MNLFSFDIETAGQYENYETFLKEDIRGADLFKKRHANYGSGEIIEDYYFNKAPVISTFGKIICISFGINSNGNIKINSIYGNDEKSIVEQFNKIVDRLIETNYILYGFNILKFDIPWLLHKLHKYDIKPSDILYHYDKKPWELRVKDLSEDWRFKSSYTQSFDEVCYELDIESPKIDISGSDVHNVYWGGGLEQIKRYCEGDVRALINIGKKIYRKDEG
jgi:predicted PolB exonuclease-like 3'-5' exonuclease